MADRNSYSGTGTFPRLIHCDNCGEDYASTYRSCPFCNAPPSRRSTSSRDQVRDREPVRERDYSRERDYDRDYDRDAAPPPRSRPSRSSGSHVPTNTRGGGYGGRSTLSMVGILISVLLVIAAIVIVIFLIRAVFSGNKPDSGSEADSGGITDVDAENPQGIVLDQTDVGITAGQTVTLLPTIDPAGWSGQLIWSSSDGAVATVDQTGLVTYVGAGTCTITVTGGDKSAVCTIRCAAEGTEEPGTDDPGTDDPGTDDPGTTGPGTTTPGTDPVVVRYGETPKEDFSMKVGEVVTLNAIGGDGVNYTWTMDRPDLASVTAEGKVIGIAPGKATLTVTSGGESTEVIVRVREAE